MTVDRSDDSVGYRRPPKHTRWKKGQSGNPARVRKSETRTLGAMIDQYLVGPSRITITSHGHTRRVTALEAILLQIFRQEMTGSKKAHSVRLAYERAMPQATEDMRVIVEGGLPDADDEGGRNGDV